MTIKELQEAKFRLDSELTNSVSNIINNFYKKNGIAPSGVATDIELTEVRVDSNSEPISSCMSISVKSKFKLA